MNLHVDIYYIYFSLEIVAAPFCAGVSDVKMQRQSLSRPLPLGHFFLPYDLDSFV